MSTVKEFMLALADLMDEHGAWLTADDEWQGYPECGQDIQIRIEHNTDYSFDPGLGGMVTAYHLRKVVSNGEENGN